MHMTLYAPCRRHHVSQTFLWWWECRQTASVHDIVHIIVSQTEILGCQIFQYKVTLCNYLGKGGGAMQFSKGIWYHEIWYGGTEFPGVPNNCYSNWEPANFHKKVDHAYHTTSIIQEDVMILTIINTYFNT